MAPTTHPCPNVPPVLTNWTIANSKIANCHDGGRFALPVRRPHVGRETVNPDTYPALDPPGVSHEPERGAEQGLKGKAWPENLVKEPAFIVAIISTALILLSGFVVVKLSRMQLAQRKNRGGGLGILASARSTRHTSPGASPTSPLVQSSPQTPTLGEEDLPALGNNRVPPLPPFSPVLSPVILSPVEALPESGTVQRPDVYIHEASCIPQIILSKPQETIFPGIEALVDTEEVGYCPIAGASEEEREAPIDDPLRDGSSSCSSSLHTAHPPSDTWSRTRHLPEQASEASDHSTECTPVDLFSSSSTISSHTSVSDASSDSGELDDYQEDYEVETTAFEVKRGHAQSVEIAKGRLVSWGTPPIVLLESLEVMGYGAEGQSPSKASRAPSPNLVKPRIPIPTLIITEPSTLSLLTPESSTSNLSIDLCQFPVPPLHLEPAVFWQRLDEEINSSLALKQRRLI